MADEEIPRARKVDREYPKLYVWGSAHAVEASHSLNRDKTRLAFSATFTLK